MLRLNQVVTHYGPIMELKGIDLHVDRGEIVCMLGGNASGKSTTLKTILGIVPARSGSLTLAGEDLTRMSTSRRCATTSASSR